MGDRIRERRLRARLTQLALATRLGVTKSAVSQWESGDIKTLKGPALVALCRELGVSESYILDGSGPAARTAPPPAGPQRRGPDSATPATAARDTRRIPVISYIQAGEPREVVDDYAAGDGFETLGVDPDLAARLGPHAFGLRVEGESMLPEFRPGDYVIVDPDAPVRPGDMVVAKLERDNAATLKKYRSRGVDAEDQPVFELVPLNDDYPTVTVSGANPGRLVGPVVEHRRRLR
jgi:SOS-response transcriptional repressor LexA